MIDVRQHWAGAGTRERVRRALDTVGYAGILTLGVYSFLRWMPRYFDLFLRSDDFWMTICTLWLYHGALFEEDDRAEAMKAPVLPVFRGAAYVITPMNCDSPRLDLKRSDLGRLDEDLEPSRLFVDEILR